MQWVMALVLDRAYLVQLANHHPVLHRFSSLPSLESMAPICKAWPMAEAGLQRRTSEATDLPSTLDSLVNSIERIDLL
jgi:hypothetical protein